MSVGWGLLGLYVLVAVGVAAGLRRHGEVKRTDSYSVEPVPVSAAVVAGLAWPFLVPAVALLGLVVAGVEIVRRRHGS